MSSGSSGVLNAARSSLSRLRRRGVGFVLEPADALVLLERRRGDHAHERVDPVAR